MALFLADVVWQALFLSGQLFTPWVIITGLAVEFVFVRYLTSMDGRTCFIAAVSMNAASALLGVLLIPLAGIAWEVFPGTILYPLLNIGTFNPITWAATFLFAVVINAGLESLVLRYFFKQKIDAKFFGWLCVANALSVALAFALLMANPPQNR